MRSRRDDIMSEGWTAIFEVDLRIVDPVSMKHARFRAYTLKHCSARFLQFAELNRDAGLRWYNL